MLEIFKTKPYLAVQMSVILQEALANAIDAWKGFLTLPDDVQNEFTLDQENTEWADPGFHNRECKERADKKRHYHYMRANEHFLFIRGKAGRVYEVEKAHRFFSAARKLNKLTGELLVSQAQKLEMDPLLLMRQSRFVTIRFLRYISQESGKEIGDRHFDYSGLTVHLFPNNGELEYYSEGEWRQFHKDQNQAAVFPGYQAWSGTEGKISPRIHRAMQWEKGERYAVVGFCPFTFCARFPKGVDQRRWCNDQNLDWFTSIRESEKVLV